MRYFTEKPKNVLCTRRYNYKCNHPLYSECTLFEKDGKGLAVVHKRFNSPAKVFWYGPIESWLADEIARQEGFESYFAKNCKAACYGLYPTVTVRQVMWALKMKPLKKSRWESQEKQWL